MRTYLSKGPYKLGISSLILLSFLVVYHITLIYSLSHEPVKLRDSEEYINSSISFARQKNFYAGDIQSNPDIRLYSKRTPFYPFLLFSLRSLGLHLNIIYIIQIFIGLINIWLAIVLLKALQIKKKLAFIILAFFIFFTPSQFIYSQFIMADIWLQLFIMMLMVAFAKYFKTKKHLWLACIIIISTLAALTKPIFLPASLLLSVLCAFLFLKNKPITFHFTFIFLPLLSWFVVCKKNEKLTSVYHYSSIGYINLLHYNTNLYLNKTIGNIETDKLLQPIAIVPHNKIEFKKNYRLVNSVCRHVLLTHFIGYSIFHLKGIVFFFLDPGRFDLFNFFRLENNNSTGFLHLGADRNLLNSILGEHPVIGMELIIVFILNILKTIGFFGLLWIRRKDFLVLTGGLIVLYISLLTGPLGASRFSLPVELIIICFAAGFYSEALKKSKNDLKAEKKKFK